MKRWRSAAVTLVVLGGAASCGQGPQESFYSRNMYADREACLRDYVASDCEPDRANSFGAGYFYGPYFWVGGARPAYDPGPGATAVSGRSSVSARVSEPMAVTSPPPSRGGFGATARYGGYRGGG
jgi:hypothetical protein